MIWRESPFLLQPLGSSAPSGGAPGWAGPHFMARDPLSPFPALAFLPPFPQEDCCKCLMHLLHFYKVCTDFFWAWILSKLLIEKSHT